ncbi:hypothetical protein [Variovorax gossypii]|jgi:Fe-S cluster biogenesis protein NfuA
MTSPSTCESSARPVSTFSIEYMTQDLFKGKSLATAARSFHRKFNGKDNLFLGRVDHTVDELMQAVLADKAGDVLQAARRMKPGNALIALQGNCARFNLDEPQLAAAVETLLAARYPDIEICGATPTERAVALVNAICSAPAPAPLPAPHEALEEAPEESAASEAAPRG